MVPSGSFGRAYASEEARKEAMSIRDTRLCGSRVEGSGRRAGRFLSSRQLAAHRSLELKSRKKQKNPKTRNRRPLADGQRLLLFAPRVSRPRVLLSKWLLLLSPWCPSKAVDPASYPKCSCRPSARISSTIATPVRKID